MDNYSRGRSPSAGSTQNKPRSPSEHNGFTQSFNGLAPDMSAGQSPTFLGPDYMSNMAQQHLSPSQQSQQHQYLSQQGGAQYGNAPGNFPNLEFQNTDFDPAFDPALLNMTDPSLGGFGSPENGISPRTANFPGISTSSFQQNSPTQNFGNVGVGMGQAGAVDPSPRHQSLSPSSAASPFGQSGREWAGVMDNFQGHRRNQSDALSDVSSHHSPFVDSADTFDLNGNSPLINGHSDPNLPESLAMGTFTLSDNMAQHISPGHSVQPSPRISPQQEGFLGAGGFGYSDGLGLSQSTQMSEQFPGIDTSGTEFDTAAHLEAPEISIQLAPERQPSFNESGQGNPDYDALSPPTRNQSRPRGRAISDPYSSLNQQISRSSTPNRNRAPSLGLQPPNAARSLSRSSSPGGPPNGVHKTRDRASSTSAVPSQREKIMNLAESDKLSGFDGFSSGPSISGGEGGPKRTQKHPATFQCTLCPKRFTRAYNLRSHLRTHTDERPFVCTVCGKAFARQHDRKRHEGLHSGEKKFVCKGLLAGGSGNAGTWGCGRRFARADALGRHFRSEAGRTCIKPLLDEEARERRAAMMEQHSQDMLNSANAANAGAGNTGGVMGAPSSSMPGMPLGSEQPLDVSNIALPAALLAQYPALAGIQWDALPMGSGGGQDDDDFGFDASGRSSFDASSGGELDFDDEAFSGNEDSWAASGANSGSGVAVVGAGLPNQQGAADWGGGYGGGG